MAPQTAQRQFHHERPRRPARDAHWSRLTRSGRQTHCPQCKSGPGRRGACALRPSRALPRHAGRDARGLPGCAAQDARRHAQAARRRARAQTQRPPCRRPVQPRALSAAGTALPCDGRRRRARGGHACRRPARRCRALRSTCGGRWTGRTRRTPAWRSTSAGRWRATRGSSRRSTRSTCARAAR